MERRNFAQILRDAEVDIVEEYNRLYYSFNTQKIINGTGGGNTLRDYCEQNFINLPFRGTCLSLDDFDNTHNFSFEKHPSNMDMNYLLTYCEYTYNLAIYSQQIGNMYYIGMQNPMQQYLQQIMRVMDRIGYMSATDNGVTIFVPKSPEMIATAEIINPKLSYKIIEYNHHLLQGDMEAKKSILLLLATELEAKRSKLKQINRKIEDDLFMLFNNMNIRHNNCDENSDNYKAYVSEMSAQQLEQWYDETYQLCLLAFLELDNFKRKEKIKELRVLIESYEKKEQ